MKERIRNFAAKFNPATCLKKLSPARGAVLGTLVITQFCFVQSWFLLSGGIIDVSAGFQLFFVIVFGSLALTCIIHLSENCCFFVLPVWPVCCWQQCSTHILSHGIISPLIQLSGPGWVYLHVREKGQAPLMPNETSADIQCVFSDL